jgi:ATPase, P-type (transporting), HAD superfamily, subfamily IC
MGNHQVFVGNAAFLEEHGIKYNIPSRPGTAIHVAVDNRYCGYILVIDKVRRRAFDALETLRVNGVRKLVLLTGDVMSVARPIASRLNFDMLRAELKPEEKARAVNYLMKNKGAHTAIAFVGEGENSGKIMSGADVGIAMGSLGSDSALASADVMIMDRDIFKIPKTLTISRLVYRVAWENFAFGIGVHAMIALLGLFGLMLPLAAVILSALTGVALLGNVLRIKKDRKTE